MFAEGALRNVDIKSKLISLQCSWVKKLFDDNCHDWKTILLFLIIMYFCKNFHFRSDLSFNSSLFDSFPDFYKKILINQSTYFVINSEVQSCIQSNFVQYNKHLLIDNRLVYLQSLTDENANFLDNLLDGSGNFKSWNELKSEFNLVDSLYFSWMQLINSIPLNWRNIIKSN